VATGELKAAELELSFVRQQAEADIRAAALAVERLTAHAATIERRQVEPAHIVRLAARAAFVEGAGDVLRLVDAERVHAEAWLELNDVRLDAVLAVITLRLSRSEEPLP
jgi:hypothetical protein